MKKHLATSILILLISGPFFAQSFEPLNFDKLQPITSIPSFTDPIVQIKNVDGKLIKNVRVPDDHVTSYLTLDCKYLIVYGKQALYRIEINGDETITVPYNMTHTNDEGITVTKFIIGSLTKGSNKAYLFDQIDMYGSSIKEKINIYEVDFNQKTVSTIMTLPINSERYTVVGAYYNKYVATCIKPGIVDIYNIETKSLFKSINFDVPQAWSNRTTDAYISFIMGSELRYQMHNFGSSDSTQKAAYKVSYNLSTNKIMHEEFRTGDNADVVFSFHPKTQKIYWTKSISQGPITQWKKQIYDDENLSNMIFEFTGVMMWQFDENDPNLIDVTYHSGKIETYNLTTKKLIATKNNGGGMNDF